MANIKRRSYYLIDHRTKRRLFFKQTIKLPHKFFRRSCFLGLQNQSIQCISNMRKKRLAEFKLSSIQVSSKRAQCLICDIPKTLEDMEILARHNDKGRHKSFYKSDCNQEGFIFYFNSIIINFFLNRYPMTFMLAFQFYRL